MFVLILLLATCLSVASGGHRDVCQPDKLVVYKVILTTFWTRDRFWKQYPEFRPHAQFSKVVGRSHDANYGLWHLGSEASNGVKIFAETGKSDVLDAESQGEGGIYDEFSAPPIATGAGRTEAEFFVDGNHSKVSLMSRIIPSPDWIIGTDSLDLCKDGKWVETMVVNVDPVDAGTDNGFTFTAPNWATSPQEKMYQITAHFPSHPANSFFYPNLKKLPTFATFKFLKEKEYALSQVFHYDEDDAIVSKHDFESKDDVNNDVDIFHYSTNGRPEPTTTTTTTMPLIARVTTTHKPRSLHVSSNVQTARPAHKVINSIVETYNTPQGSKRRINRKRSPRNCQVSEWSDWLPCSVSCGLGESTRSRTVLKHNRRGGKPCPQLVERKWCGSARACKGTMKDYFNWS